MFDVTAATTITIQGFDINTCDTGSTLVEVYYKAGTSVGYDQNAAAWTFLGSALVSPAGSDNPTSLPVGGLTIPAGATYGLYLTTTGGGCGFNYTDGTTDYSNSDLTIHNGYGKSYPFGDTYQPRIWNGTIYYTAGAGYDLSFFDDAGTSQLCVNSTTGAWKWNVLKGTKAGQSYSATGIVQKIASGFMIYSKPAQTYWALKLQYVSANHTALGYFRYPLKGVVSNLMDSNTLNDPPCY